MAAQSVTVPGTAYCWSLLSSQHWQFEIEGTFVFHSDLKVTQVFNLYGLFGNSLSV